MDYSLLAGSPLFKGLTIVDIESNLTAFPYRVKRFKEGSLICQSGEEVTSLMIVLNGIVKGEMIDLAGRTINIEDIKAPGALASAFLFGNTNRYPVNVVSITDTELFMVDKSDFLMLLMKNEKILLNFLDMISNRSQFLSEKIKYLNFKTIKGKLAQYILKLAGESKNVIKFDRTQKQLADYFGVARPSISRVLNEMEKDGFIEVKGKNIVIYDSEELIRLTKD